MEGSGEDRVIVFAAVCHQLLSRLSSSSPPAIDYSLDRRRRRRPSTTLFVIAACHLWIVVIAAYHRLLSGHSSPPLAIDYSLDRLHHRLPSTTRLLSTLPAIYYSFDRRLSFCSCCSWVLTEPERNENGNERLI